MKLLSSVALVSLGIWLAYNKPEFASVAIGYINIAVEYLSTLLNNAGV